MSDWAKLIEDSLRNQFFTGGAAIVVMTAVLAYARNLPTQLLALLERRFVTTADITDHDAAFFWLQAWLGKHEYTQRAKQFRGALERVIEERSMATLQEL